MFITDICIKRPILATVVLLTLMILGGVSYTKLGVQLFPEVEFPVVVVSTTYRGAGPAEVEQLITKPIEDNVTLVENIKYIESTSSEGNSTVAIRFEMGTDVDVAANDVRDKVAQVEPDLPRDIDKPMIMKIDPNAFPILRLAVSGNRPLRDVYQIADDQIKTAFGQVAGVGIVRIVGGETREILVSVSQQKLDAAGVTIAQILNAVATANIEMPGGHILAGRQEYSVRLLGKFDNVRQIEAIPIPGAPQGITIGDVATVSDTVEEVRKLARLAGQSSVAIEVLKRADANTIQVGDGIKKAIKRLTSGALPHDVRIEIVTDDTTFIKSVVAEVNSSMVSGIFLTAIAIFLFLHNWRGTFITAMAMPASVITTYIVIYAAGYSINMMSMMGLAISIGTLVNNAILVLENVHRLIDLGLSPREAASKGTSEIAVAVMGSTLTNVVVFLPIGFMQSIVGQVFRQFALTVVFATFVSLFISFTVTPMLAALLLKPKGAPENRLAKRLHNIYAVWDGVYDSMALSYRRSVEWVMRKPWTTIGLGALAFLLVMFTIPRMIGSEFFPDSDQGQIGIEIEADVSVSLAFTDAITRQVEAMAERIPEKEKVFATVGSISGSKFQASGNSVNIAQVVIKLIPRAERVRSTAQIMDSLRRELAAVPGAVFTVSSLKQGGPGGRPIELEIRGDDLDIVNGIAGRCVSEIKSLPGLVDVDSEWREGKPEIALRPIRERLQNFRVTVQSLADTLRACYDGTVASRYREGDDEHDIRVRLDESDRNDLSRLPDITAPNIAGQPVKLVDLAQQSPSTGPTQLKRKDRQRLVAVTANVSGTSPGEAHAAIVKKLANMHLPEGYRFTWGGDIEFMQENFRDLYSAMILAILLTYLLLAGLLESWLLGLLIMLSLPLSFAGVYLALLITAKTTNIFSLMGMVMLIGLVINNAIVIVDYIEVLRQEGKPLREAIPEACAVRLRPILMATITALIAMLPLALGMGEGGEFRSPMAVAQMGGMAVGGFLALLITPALYVIARRRKEAKTAVHGGAPENR